MPLGVVFAGQLRSAESQGIWTHGTPMTSGRARRPPAGVSGRDPEQSQTAGSSAVAACDWSGLRPRPRAARARPLDDLQNQHERIRMLSVNPRPVLSDWMPRAELGIGINDALLGMPIIGDYAPRRCLCR